jgi:hypothetical protein
LNVGTFEPPQGIERLERLEPAAVLIIPYAFAFIPFCQATLTSSSGHAHDHGFCVFRSCQKPVKSNTLRKILADLDTNVSPDCCTTAPQIFPKRF